jgi:hypothetical protein
VQAGNLLSTSARRLHYRATQEFSENSWRGEGDSFIDTVLSIDFTIHALKLKVCAIG